MGAAPAGRSLFLSFHCCLAVLGVDRTTTTELRKDSTEKKKERESGAAQERRSGRAHLGG
jgi:hypothetical protein